MTTDVPILDRLVLSIALKGESAAPLDVLRCLGTEVDQDSDSWVRYFNTSESPGSCRISAHTCDEPEHDYHVTLEFRRGWTSSRADVPDSTLENAIDCFSSLSGRVDDVYINVSHAFPKDGYLSILEDHRHSFAGEEIGSAVKLTGVELDFSDSDIPIDSLRISETMERIYVMIVIYRDFDVGDRWLKFIQNDTLDTVQSFVRPASDQAPNALEESDVD